MSNSVDATLQDAFDLIEQNQLQEARNILEPLLQSDSDNPAVWWIYAHAVETPEEGNQALDKVLQLDPTYPGASDLKTQITESQASADVVDDWDDLEFEPDAEFSETTEKKRSPIRFLLFSIVVIIVVVAIFAVLSGVFGAPPPTPTDVAEVADTEIPTINPQIVSTEVSTEESTESSATDDTQPTDTSPTEDTEPTEEPTTTTVPPTEEPTDIPPTDTVEPTEETAATSSLATDLAEYEVTESDIEVRSTLLGETLVVNVCSTPGPESSLVLNGVMDVLVASDATLSDDIGAIAVSLIDCANDDGAIRTIGVDRATVQQLSNNEIELKDFQRAWQPLP